MATDEPLPCLAALLAPTLTSEFLARHWEQEPLHIRRDIRGHHASIATREEFEALIAGGDLRYPALQLARDGSYFPEDAYTASVKHGAVVFSGVPDLEKVTAEYRSGATLVLPAIHHRHAALRALAARLEAELDHAVHANAYLAPGNAQGFLPHYDTHDVFVLQLAGSKRWRVFEPPVRLPHRSQRFSPIGYTPPPPLLDLELHEGDLLYLPRGYVHTAATTDESSVHVTLGVTVYTWFDLAMDALEGLKAQASMRRALPLGFARRATGDSPLAEEFTRLLATETSTLDAARAARTFVDRVRAARPLRERPTFDSSVHVITLATTMAVREGLVPNLEAGPERVLFSFGGRSLALPLGVRGALEQMIVRRSFVVRELTGQLDSKAALAFARFLEAEGFLVQARPQQQTG